MTAPDVRLGVIGVGHLGRHHARIAAALPGAAFVAAVDVDAVTVAVPTVDHLAVAREFLQRGVHVLVEKPMTSSLAEADEMLRCADAAGVILAERPDLSEKLTLLVDVGTNAEIVLGNKERLLACSSPTGPAFEGAQISCGQRAAPGAIERVRINAATLEAKFKVIGSDLWSDEPGFEAAVARTGVTGICGSGIIEVIAEMYLAGIISHDGVIDGALTARSERIVASGRTFSYTIYRGAVQLQITQNDVRAIQLAKAALYAGIRLLMDHLKVAQVDRIRLAGAFGSHIDVKYAMVLGMIPDCDLAQVSSAGNAAGTGARIALLDNASRRTIEELVRRVEKIETAIEPKFQAHFVAAMGIPHSTAANPWLSQVVNLPQHKAAAPRAGAKGRRRPQA